MSPGRHPPAPAGSPELLRLTVIAAGVGIGCGATAWLLYRLIGLLSNLVFFQRIAFDIPAVQHHHLGALVVVVPALGGLVVGLMARFGSDRIRGHGIPEAMESVLFQRSRIAPRVALLKPISAAIAIGTGGPFGAEGPIIQTGGALGSVVGQTIRTTAAERKVLLACGAAAGMAATFSTPIAAVILALELLLFEFKARSFIPLVVATTLATAIRFVLMGPGPMFQVAPADFRIWHALPGYIVLGLLCGLLAVGFTRMFYRVEDWFERLPLDRTWWPAIGGLGLGLIALLVPRVLGVGYDTISDILNARLAVLTLLGILIFKSLALMVSLGSGTSGGLLAPMFMVGAALGGLFAVGTNALIPGAHLDPGACALVAMAAVFGAAARATFTFIIFGFELTRDYNAILPLMLVCVIADGLALLLMRNSIMTEKLARRGLVVNQEFETDAFQNVLVSEVMDRELPAVPGTLRVAELVEAMVRGDAGPGRASAQLVLQPDGSLAGIVTRSDLLAALEEAPAGDPTVQEAATRELVVAWPDERLSEALTRMLQHDVGRLPVVSREDPSRPVGYLGRAAVLRARLQRYEEEHIRDHGWLTSWRTGAQPG